ncbi:hypothetical protein [Rheinheimera faecalis]|uniref:hypothetical protein n=1 Tax=Rheinheimera faecalis TaxID=2901141 RepID=UPI001E604438|nr:hypothetical protein [Rheinheimera faecalis]
MSDVSSIFRIKESSLIKSSFELRDKERAKTGGSLDFHNEVEIHDDENCEFLEIVLTMTVTGMQEDDVMFIVMSSYSCLLEVVNKKRYKRLVDFDKATFGVRHIYPLLRQDVISTLAKAGMGHVPLPFDTRFVTSSVENTTNPEEE